jgi:hypothetical protein
MYNNLLLMPKRKKKRMRMKFKEEFEFKKYWMIYMMTII